MKNILPGFLATILFALSAAAHSVWIESTNQQLVIRFAEPGDDFETSPGFLDDLTAPAAFSMATNVPLKVEAVKKPDHFWLKNASITNVACVETAFTVRGGRKPNFYARWQPAGISSNVPLLTLDSVPTGKPGEVRVYLRGQPLPNVKATLMGPDNKDTDLTADAEGFIRFAADQPGQYLLTIAHQREPLAGFHNGIVYKETSHNCSLVWQQAKSEK